MSAWRVEILGAVRRSIRSLPEPWPERVLDAIAGLREDPEAALDAPNSNIQLRGHRKYRRLRIGPYRIIFRITNRRVIVSRVEARSERTYRGFNPGEGLTEPGVHRLVFGARR